MFIRVIAVHLCFCLSFPGIAAFNEDCPAYTSHESNPKNNNSPDWSKSAQGIANDGTHWFFTNEGALYKYEADWSPIDNANDRGHILSVGIPPELEFLGINHFGDPDYYDGYIFVPFEGEIDLLSGRQDLIQPTSAIAVFRASDLHMVDWFDLTEIQRIGWIAIDPVEEKLFTSQSTLRKNDNGLRVYDLDISRIENGISHDFLDSGFTTIKVFESDGSPFQGSMKFMQGGVFTPAGDLFVIAGTHQDSISSVRGGIHLLRRWSPRSFRLIHSSVSQNVFGRIVERRSGAEKFIFNYNPAVGVGENISELSGGQEPEGIDWWNNPDPKYPGQLHALLLKNSIGDDEIWIRHYTVDYGCQRQNGRWPAFW